MVWLAIRGRLKPTFWSNLGLVGGTCLAQWILEKGHGAVADYAFAALLAWFSYAITGSGPDQRTGRLKAIIKGSLTAVQERVMARHVAEAHS